MSRPPASRPAPGPPGLAASDMRRLGVGNLLDPVLVRAGRARVLEAVAVVTPGPGRADNYLSQLEAARADLAAWDGRIVVQEPDGQPHHRVTIVDRYGQVYAVMEAPDAEGLPDASALEEWFRFLSTACPECGVPDEPIGRGWVP